MNKDNQRLQDILSALNDDENFILPSEEFNDKDLEHHILHSEWMLEKVRNSEVYAQNLYAAFCNNRFVQSDNTWDMLATKFWSVSWRSAGSIVADIIGTGDYMDWYSSGIGSENQDDEFPLPIGYVPEGRVTDEIKNDLRSLGWIVVKDN
jgi:hypothetical protein